MAASVNRPANATAVVNTVRCLRELPQPVSPRRRACLDCVARQVALDVASEAGGRCVAPGAVFLERFHHNPVELALDQPGQSQRFGMAQGRNRRQSIPRFVQPGARLGGLFLADPAQDLGVGRLAQLAFLERRRAGQEFVQEHAQRVNVRPRVDVERSHLGLLGAHVLERAHGHSQLGEHRLFRQPVVDRLGDAEVDHLRHRLAVGERHQHIRRFDVAVDESFLMGMLNGLANRRRTVRAVLSAKDDCGRNTR